MSHFRERKDKNCLNCGATVLGRYCQNCGQENVEIKMSFGQLVMHFFEDFTHFDGKFFQSLKLLFLRPGFLSLEFVRGRRAAYLNPARMYIFSSAIFFFLIYLVYPNTAKNKPIDINATKQIVSESTEMKQLQQQPEVAHLVDSIKRTYKNIGTEGIEGSLRERYDALLKKYNGENNLRNAFEDKIKHYLPFLLFVSLPLIGMALKLLYIRRERYYYTDHIIFSVHFYIFFFFIFLISTILERFDMMSRYTIFYIASILLWIWFWLYLLIALKRFYKQSWGKTIAKMLILIVTQFLLVIFLFLALVLISLLLI